MSSTTTTTPITPHQFAEAIKELPLANLHFKAAEIRNAISHLQSSNQQLKQYADDGDTDCKEAIEENVVVVRRMEERILLLKEEVEGRGFRWGEDEQERRTEGANGNGDVGGEAQRAAESRRTEHSGRPGGGTLGDEELARRLAERMDDDGDEDNDGVHL